MEDKIVNINCSFLLRKAEINGLKSYTIFCGQAPLGNIETNPATLFKDATADE